MRQLLKHFVLGLLLASPLVIYQQMRIQSYDWKLQAAEGDVAFCKNAMLRWKAAYHMLVSNNPSLQGQELGKQVEQASFK